MQEKWESFCNCEVKQYEDRATALFNAFLRESCKKNPSYRKTFDMIYYNKGSNNRIYMAYIGGYFRGRI